MGSGASPNDSLCGSSHRCPARRSSDTAAIRAVCCVCVRVCVRPSAGPDAAPCHDHRARFTSFRRFLFSLPGVRFFIFIFHAPRLSPGKRRVKRLHAGPALKLAFVWLFTPRWLCRMLLRVKFTPTSKCFYITPFRNMKASKYETLKRSKLNNQYNRNK